MRHPLEDTHSEWHGTHSRSPLSIVQLCASLSEPFCFLLVWVLFSFVSAFKQQNGQAFLQRCLSLLVFTLSFISCPPTRVCLALLAGVGPAVVQARGARVRALCRLEFSSTAPPGGGRRSGPEVWAWPFSAQETVLWFHLGRFQS